MLRNIYKMNITKNAIALYELIYESDNFYYSIAEIADKMDITKPTVNNSLKALVQHKLVNKIDFFIGKVRRCKYTIANNIFNRQENLTIKNNLPIKNIIDAKNDDNNCLENTSSDVVLGKKNTSSKTNPRTSKTIIFRPPDLIDNNINKYNIKSNQSDINRFDLACQVQNSKKFDKILEKIPEGTAKREIYNLLKTFSKKKNDGDKLVTTALDTKPLKCLQDLFLGVVNRFAKRCLDKSQKPIRQIGGYLRTSIVKAVKEENEKETLVSECEQLVSATEGAFKMAKLARNSIVNAKNITYKNFEHRPYTDEDFEAMYSNHCYVQ